MASAQLLLGSALSIAAGLAYWALAVHYARRATADARPRALFALFWWGVGFFGVTDGAWSLAVAYGPPPLWVGVAILHLKVVFGVLGFASLVGFVLYLYRGQAAPLVALATAYVPIYALVAWSYVVQRPVDQQVEGWRAGLVYAESGGTFATIALALLFLPPVIAAVTYAALARRAPDLAHRRRIQATSLAIATFLGTVFIAWLVGAAPWWPPAEKLLGIATASIAWATLARTGAA